MPSRHRPLGPLLWSRVDEAEATASLERTPWQKGIASAAAAFDQPRSYAGAAHSAAASVTGGYAGAIALSGLPLSLQLAAFAVAGVVAYWTVPTLWASLVALDAPPKQRDEARNALSEEKQRAASALAELRRQHRTERLHLITAVRQPQILQTIELVKAHEARIEEMKASPEWEAAGSLREVMLRIHKPSLGIHPLRQWVEEILPLLNEGGRADLASQFALTEQDALGSSAGIEAAFERRKGLVQPPPEWMA